MAANAALPAPPIIPTSARYRLLAQGRPQFRPPRLRLQPRLPATSTTTTHAAHNAMRISNPNPFRINTYRSTRKC